MTAETLISWAVTALVVVSIVGFVAYLISLRHLPSDERPCVPTYDRHGARIGEYPNPGPDIAPGRPGDNRFIR
ncbi:hypothetical protein [Mycobacterium scrofulaceum]|uniref:hypothetical protein n=1 Tax=Mycobacterium scrofulaceum TaxID=1783 RepID=UPI00114E3226|nr:hypothetical protein [Mycobacterium scrofulaceum]